MMPSALRLARLIAGSAALLLVARSGHADEQASYKAAIVYNIIRFAEFDGRQVRSSVEPLRLCAVTSDAFSAALAGLEGRRVGSRTLDVRLIGSLSDAGAGCDIAYVGSDTVVRRPPPDVLLIGDAPDFTKNGGAVGLIRLGRQIRFEINIAAAKAAGVTFSSKLLRLASDIRNGN